MARPKKNNADYFPHDSGMRNDPRIKAVRSKFGIEGYAIWTMILESLTDADFFELKADPVSIEIMAGDFEIDSDKLNQIIDYLTFIGLLQTDSDKQKFFSKRHQNNFSALLMKRKRDRNRVFDSENNQCDSENPQSKAKDIKGKDNTPYNPPKGKDVELKNFLLKNIPDDLRCIENKLVEYFEYRQQKTKAKRYKSTRGISGLFRDLCNCVVTGYDPSTCLDIAMERDWQTPDPTYFKPEMFKSIATTTTTREYKSIEQRKAEEIETFGQLVTDWDEIERSFQKNESSAT